MKRAPKFDKIEGRSPEGFVNNRFKSIEPEDAQVGKEYAFTINPEIQPVKVALDKPDAVLNMGLSHLHACLGKLCYSKLRLNVELSSTGRLHWHGYITILDIIGFYTVDMRHLMSFGSFDIHPIKEFVDNGNKNNKYKTWEEYISKQSKLYPTKYNNVLVPKKTAKLVKGEKVNKWFEEEGQEDDTI